MGPLSISVLFFTALLLGGVFTAPRAQVQRGKKVISGRPMGNTSATGNCPSGWKPFGSRCFHYISQRVSWTHAQVHCTQLGASLASIHSLEEYHFVQNMTRGSLSTCSVAWVGGTDALQNIWLWIDGTPFNYAQWTSGRPSHGWFFRENCLEINFGGQNLWNNAYCTNWNPYVCAKQCY